MHVMEWEIIKLSREEPTWYKPLARVPKYFMSCTNTWEIGHWKKRKHLSGTNYGGMGCNKKCINIAAVA